MRRGLLAGVALLSMATCSSAQSLLYYEGFESGSTGWTFDAPVGGCSWGVDGTPAMSFGVYSCAGLGDPVPQSPVFAGAAALNFNNGTDMDYGTATTTGVSATGPTISVTSLAGVTMTFQDFYECDSCAVTNTHRRFIEFISTTGTVLKSVQLTYGDGIDTEHSCAPPPLPPTGDIPGNWNNHHMHTIDLSTLGTTDFRIRFRMELDAAVGIEVDCCGWFVDELQVICPLPDATTPTLPTQIIPVAASTVVSPVTFDWTDSTDTGPCGPGAVQYLILIDDISTLGIDYGFFTTASTRVQALPPGSYTWTVEAFDGSFNGSGFTPDVPFDVELNLAPTLPDTLHVNEDHDGAQQGDTGFVDPVIDESPVFSAIYRDLNAAPDFAIGLRFQVASDALFAALVFDSGPVGISPPLPDDARCPDLTINLSLQRDTVYYWRIQFTDAGGLTGPFSVPQSFRIGDDFEFGVRKGSSHHGRRCWVATAAFGSEEAAPVGMLQSWRAGTLDRTAAGSVASRAYHVIGAEASTMTGRSSLVRSALSPLASATGGAGMLAIVGFAALLGFLGLGRAVRP